jgi:UDP-N-acetylglucosamine 2-epimerase (non-hydrolysing)
VRVLTICGTRPELIRLSELIKKLDRYTDHIFVHTGQSFDYEMNQIFFDQLKIRTPNYLLDVKADTIGEQIGNILQQTEKVMLKEKPDVLVILGDTNSCLSCITAKRLHIPIFHLEAGNRAFSEKVPEEVNRRIVDHTSDINMCYTEHARRNLLAEGIKPQNIFVTGSPLPEVYEVHRSSIGASDILKRLQLEKDEYFLASLHREENVRDLTVLNKLMDTLYLVSEKYNKPIMFSTHPRTKKNLHTLGIESDSRIIFHEPFGLFDYVKLQLNAFCVLSDSGTIHEDSAILGVSSLHIRENNERPEVYDTGNIVMAGFDSDVIMSSIDMIVSQRNVKFEMPLDYRDKNNSDKVVRLIVGLSKVVAKKIYG